MVSTFPNDPPACSFGGVLVLPLTIISNARKPVPMILFKAPNLSFLVIVDGMDFQ